MIHFDDNVSSIHKRNLTRTIINTTLIKESIFLFSNNDIIDLDKVPKRGLFIKQLEKQNGKYIFRAIIKTRTPETYNIVINLNDSLDKKFFDDEIKWLIAMGRGYENEPLVENFGGYWAEYQLYTEKYVYGETLENYLQRNKDDIKDPSKKDRWQMRWLHFIWNGIQAYQEFWKRTNFKLSIQPPSPKNLIIPQRDYATGTKIISISRRKSIKSIGDHFLTLYTDYIIRTEKRFPGLKHMSNWEVIFTATLQTLKVKNGTRILKELIHELKQGSVSNKLTSAGCTINRIEAFFQDIEQFGVLTKPVVFASLRYERWYYLNPAATLQARANILHQLYNDYHLDNLIEDYPETRVRFFLMTCFKNSSDKLLEEFRRIISKLRKGHLNTTDIENEILKVQGIIKLDKEEKFFLLRMLFPHINSADYAEIIKTAIGKKEELNLVFQTEGEDKQYYKIRPPFLPKEIAQFHTLLSESLLNSTFTVEHKFLLIFNLRNRLVGGLFWKPLEKQQIHLEWVAIKPKYRGFNLSRNLMNDFFKRMKYQNIKAITVGFYVEKFFSKYGFKLDKEFGGLVKLI